MNDTDFEQFIKLLDAALVSDDKKIKTALRKFMFIMALNLSEDDCEPGPFTQMMDTIDELQRRVGTLEVKDNSFTTTDPYTQTWPYGYAGIGTGTPPPYVAPGTSSGSTQWMNTTTSTSIPFTTGGCWGGSSTSATYTINPEDEKTGTEIKDEIKDKLAALANST